MAFLYVMHPAGDLQDIWIAQALMNLLLLACSAIIGDAMEIQLALS